MSSTHTSIYIYIRSHFGSRESSSMISILLQKLSGDEPAKLQLAPGSTMRELRQTVCNLESCRPWSFGLQLHEHDLQNVPESVFLEEIGLADGARLTLLKTNLPAVLSCSDDNTAKIWHSGTGQCWRTLQGHGDYVDSAIFSADATRILTTCPGDNTVKIWDSFTGECQHTLGDQSRDMILEFTRAISAAEFSPDGSRVLVSFEDNTTRMYSSSTGECQHTLSGCRAVFSADGSRILTVSPRIWDPCAGMWIDFQPTRIWFSSTGECQHALSGHGNDVNCGVFSADGLRVLTASKDTTAKIWDGSTGECEHTLSGHVGHVFSAVFSADGSRILTIAFDHTVKIWDGSTGECRHTLVEPESQIISAVFSADGLRVLTASNDTRAKIWDSSTGKRQHTFSGHEGPIRSAVFSADGTRVLTASDDATVRIWDSSTGECQTILSGHGEAVYSAMFSTC